MVLVTRIHTLYMYMQNDARQERKYVEVLQLISSDLLFLKRYIYAKLRKTDLHIYFKVGIYV